MTRPTPTIAPSASARRAGVTLLELMVTLSVIGIALAVTLPALSMAGSATREGELQATLIRAGHAQERYASVHTRYWTAGQPEGLADYGLTVPADIALFVSFASETSYCMETYVAGDDGQRFSLAPGEPVTEESCESRFAP
jgi:prepilin-type N-terminal cleavage/methylation domain-containing protein